MSSSVRAFAIWSVCLVALPANCVSPSGTTPVRASDRVLDEGPTADPEGRRLATVESDLLALVNRERGSASPSRRALRRDPGADRIILWHVAAMADGRFLSHSDPRGRDTGDRVLAYAADRATRCSEIVQWWSGPPDGRAHYDGYFRSPTHHAAYMEEGDFDLGPGTLVGVAAVSGPGPAGTAYEGVSGSYTGMLFCDRPVALSVDPFDD